MADFFHGVRTREFLVGPRQARTPKTGVIFLVGTAPQGPVNVPTLTLTDTQDVGTFGAEAQGFTIPAALRALRDEGAGAVVVVNVPRQTQQGDGPPADSLTYQAVIGGVDAETGRRTGLALVEDVRSLLGFDPSFLIAPGYSEEPAVAVALASAAEKVRALAFADVADALSVQQVLQGRGAGGAHNLASTRLFYCYPRVKVYNKAAKTTALEPLSTYAAGGWAAKDEAKGWWWSLSNTKLRSVLGTSRPITSREDDANCEASLLNAAGVLTIFSDYGSGYLLWGNRTSAMPGSNTPDTHGSVRRIADVVESAIQRAGREFVDAPPTKGTLDTILETINSAFRGWQADGAVFKGEAFLDKTKNQPADVANGRVVIGYRFMPMGPMESLEFEAFIDITLARVG